MAAIVRHKISELIWQVNVTRVSVWGEEKDIEKFISQVRAPPNSKKDNLSDPLAAFGLKLNEQ